MQTTLSMLRNTLMASAFFFSLTGGAQTPPSQLLEAPGPIRYAGVQSGMLLFDVQLDSLSDRSVLRIFDGEDNLLHAEAIRSALFRKRYKIMTDNTRQVRFEVVSPQGVLRQAFDIAVRIEETLVVTAAR